MIDELIIPFLRKSDDLMSLLPTLDTVVFPPNGDVIQIPIWYRRIPQKSPRPCIVVFPLRGYNVGQLAVGVLALKQATLTMCVCGDDEVIPLNRIKDQLEKIICGDRYSNPIVPPVQGVWIPAADADSKVFIQALTWQEPMFHDRQSVDGGELGMPHWEIPLQASFYI